jgi:hypothetical protein
MSNQEDSPLRKMILQDIRDKENEMKKGFSELDKLNRPKVPEAIFVRDFLPAFSGEIPCSSELLGIWYTISGSPFNRVSVVNQIGEVVAIVPPFQNRDSIPTKNSSKDLTAIFMEHDSITNISPNAATNKLATQLDQKFIQDYNKTEVNSNPIKQEWDTLLKHYGKLKGVAKSTGSVNIPVVDDDLEYE